MVAELYFRQTPLTVASFVGLAEGKIGPRPGSPYFDGLRFHRVVPDFVIQGGDPLGTGEGGPGYEFPDEFAPGLSHDAAGVLSMANGGPGTNGSQFFITLAETRRLDYLHSVFGRVVEGLDLMGRVQQGDIMKVRILRLGREAQAFAVDKEAFGALLAKAKRYQGSEEPGPSAAFDDPDAVLQKEPPRARNFNFKLSNLEAATGLRIRCRVLGKTPAVLMAEGEARERFLLQAAGLKSLGAQDLVALFCADTKTWYLRFGSSLVRKASVSKVGVSDTQACLAASRLREEQFLETARRAAPPGASLIEAQVLKLRVDAMIETLIAEFVR